MTKLKRKGFVLFQYYQKHSKYAGYTDVIGFYPTLFELHAAHNSALDDKWDLEGRHKIHWFYLSCVTGRYGPLLKWSNDYDKKLKFDQCEKVKLSTKIY